MSLVLSAGLFIVGAVWVLLGWRGKRIGDHPFCHRCGFDLFGLPAGSTACSECGADVTRRGAVRAGRRVLRKGRLALGLALLISMGLYLGRAGYNAWNPQVVLRHEPAWWLARRIERNPAKSRGAALSELERRLAARTLDQAMIDRVVRRLLALQGDPKQPWWDPGWWDFVEQAKGLNLIQDADWKRYAKQAATRSVGLKVRPTVRRGEPLPLQLRGWGLLTPEQSRLRGRCSIVGLHFDDAGEIKTSLNGLRMNVGGGEISAKAPATLLAALEEGPHTLHLTMKIDVFTGAMNAAPPTVSCEIKRAASFMLVSAGAPTLLPLIVPSLQPAVQTRVRVFRADNSSARLTVQIHVDRMPVDLAYDVWVRTDKEQWKLASFNYPKRADKTTWTLQDGNGHGIPPHFDVILKPSTAVAEGTVNLTSYWDHEMVFKDVSTEDARPQSATRHISRRPSQPAAIRPVLERRAW